MYSFADLFISALNDLQKDTYQINVDHGFEDGPQNFGEKLALVHSELSEALEYYRKDFSAKSNHIPEFTGIEEEFADAIIRLMNMSQSLGLRLGEAIIAKNEFNRNRPYKHGGKKI